MWKTFFSRLSEPSTWAGLAAITAAVASGSDVAHVQQVGQGVAVVAGLVAGFLPEGK